MWKPSLEKPEEASSILRPENFVIWIQGRCKQLLEFNLRQRLRMGMGTSLESI